MADIWEDENWGKIQEIALEDVRVLKEKNALYKGSWKKRGGVGAFMMLARKWDRLEAQVREEGWDIFEALRNYEMAPDGIMDDIQDLRRYLLLVEGQIKRG